MLVTIYLIPSSLVFSEWASGFEWSYYFQSVLVAIYHKLLHVAEDQCYSPNSSVHDISDA